jgi:uncharacterized protein
MMSREVFLDANGWFALLNSTDILHAEAGRVWSKIDDANQSIVVTDWVIAETGNGLARSKRTNRFAEAVARMLDSPRSEVVFVGPDLLRRALAMYAQHSDKSWGLVDCTSFLVMQDRGIIEAFTNDRHFEQAGFRRLQTV